MCVDVGLSKCLAENNPQLATNRAHDFGMTQNGKEPTEPRKDVTNDTGSSHARPQDTGSCR